MVILYKSMNGFICVESRYEVLMIFEKSFMTIDYLSVVILLNSRTVQFFFFVIKQS